MRAPEREAAPGASGDGPVGRDAQLARLGSRLVDAQAGRGGLVVVTGEAGIGKSRVLAEAARRARARGMTVLTGRALAGGGAFRPLVEALLPAARPPLARHERLAPFRAVLARLLPGWPPEPIVVPSVVDPVVQLGEAVLELLGVIGDEAARPGVLLALDDLHWADRDTLALLGYLAGRLATAAVLVLGAARDEEPGHRAVGELLHVPGAEALVLPRLGRDEVLALAAARARGPLPPDVARFVLDAGDGLPLLVEELVAALFAAPAGAHAAPVPRTLAALTTRRLADLPGPARDVVRTAAVLGGGIEWRLLPTAAGLDDEQVARALRHAVQSNLLTVDAAADGGLRWRHALTRDAVLATLLPPERAALAQRAVAALCGGVTPDAADLAGERLALAAELLAQAGRDAEAARLQLRLAREAVDSGALRSAEDGLIRARELGAADDAVCAEVAVEQVRVLALAGHAAQAAALGEGLLDTLDGELRVLLCLHLARAAVVSERFTDAARYLAPVADTGDARVQALRAHVALGADDLSAALTTARAAAAAGERDGRPEAVCEALEVVGRCLRRSDPDAAEEAFTRAGAVAGQHGLHVWQVRALSEVGAQDLLRNGRSDRLEEGRRLAERAGMLATVAVLDVQLAGCVSVRDGHVAALPFARRAVEAADRLGLPAVGAAGRFFVAQGRLCVGDPSGVEPLLGEAVALAPGSVDVAFRVAGLRAWTAWLDGDDEAAAGQFERAVAALREHSGSAPTPFWGQWALLRTLAGDPDAAVELRTADVTVQAGNAAALCYADAIARARAGRRAEAHRLIEAGDAAADPHPYWRHVLRLMLAETAAAEGFGRPHEWLRAALSDLEPAGEVALARRCRDSMRRLGLPVPRARRDGPVVPAALRRLGVTARELEVLALVEQGLTNGEIAARLVLSPRTVETHVGNLLAKIGVRSRIELARRRSAQSAR